MSQPEQKLWTWMSKKMGSAWFAQRVENKAGVATPDLYFMHEEVGGWIEMKSTKTYGSDDSLFRLPGWTAPQRNWMQNHMKRGGATWLVVQIETMDEILCLPDRIALGWVDWVSTGIVRNSEWVLDKRTCSASSVLDTLKKR